jgi:hypothetical protein
MRRDIHHHHEGYLIRHGGLRPEEPESDHHAIEPYRVKKWENEWQLLGLRTASQSPPARAKIGKSALKQDG